VRPGQVVAQPDGLERELGAFADRLGAISGHVRLKWASGCSRSKPMTLLKTCPASWLRFISRQTWPISATPARNAPSPARYLRAVLQAWLFESRRLTRPDCGADRHIIAPTSDSRGARLTGNATAKRQTDRLGAPVLTLRFVEHCCPLQSTVRCPHTTHWGSNRLSREVYSFCHAYPKRMDHRGRNSPSSDDHGLAKVTEPSILQVTWPPGALGRPGESADRGDRRTQRLKRRRRDRRMLEPRLR